MTEKKSGAIERIALTPVPASERQHWISVTLIQAGFMISATSLWTGSIMIDGLSLAQIVIAGIIGYVIVVAICWAQGIMGSDLGVPSIVVATSSFGDRGSQFIVSIADSICCIGWFGINANICGEAFSGLMGECFGIDIPVKVSIIVWGIIMVTTAAIGFNGLKYLNMIAVPIMCVVTIIGVFIVLSGNGFETLTSFVPATNNVTFIGGIDMVIGGFIVGAVLSADYTRYQRTRNDVLKSSFLGILPIGVILLWAGAAFAIVAGSEDLTVIFIGLGIPVLGLLSLILSTWPANSANAYSAGLGFIKVFRCDDKYRVIITFISGLIGTIVGSFEIIYYFEEFLTYLGVVIAPFAGVMLVDYFIIGKGDPGKWAPTKGVNWAGMIALAIGVVAGFVIPYGIVSVNGVIVAGIATIILRKVMPAQQTTTLEDIHITIDE
ncbi:MAG: cytosine permease [Firmicutes bacterium]|nr:cytosine permease [Bacillota bacterium]